LPFQSASGRFYLVGENADGWIINEVVNGKPVQRAVVENGKYVNSTLSEIITINNIVKSTVYEFRPDTYLVNENPEVLPSVMLIDRDSTQWFGTEEGVYKMFGEGFTTYSRQYLPTVWSITEDLKGTIWFSSFNLGLKKLKDGIISTVHLPDPAMRWNLYFHPSVDKRGRLFFTCYNGTVVMDGKRIYQEKNKPSISSFYDHEMDLLFLGYKDTAKVFSSDLKLVRKISATDGFLVGANVLAVQKDRDGFYWFAGGRGLVRYDWESNKVYSYNELNGRFSGGGSWVIHNDYYKRSWFGTKQGLYWYDNKADSVKKLEVDELTGSVNMVGSIDSTWLIVSQPYGIYLMDLQKYYKTGKTELYLYNEKNGFQGIEPGQDGAFTDSKGNVWMTTSTEVVKLNPAELKIGKYSLNVRIDKCNNQKIPFSSGSIHLSHNQNSAVITFDAICFNRPNPVEYSWKLDRDSTWSSWQVEDYAVLSHLPDGENTFYVKAKIKGLPVDVLPLAEMNVVVEIAIYRQPWFFPTLFLLVSLIGILLLFSAVLKSKQAGREAKVFQVQAIQSQMNPHFIFNVLASLQSMILKSNVEKANDYLVKLADLVRGFLEASAGTGTLKNPKSAEGQVTIKEELQLLSEFVEFQQIIHPNRFDFELKIDPYLDIKHEMIPPMLIQPFIENAIRHGILPSGRKGLLKLTFMLCDEALIVEISDNGVGIEKAVKMIEKSPMHYTSRGKELTLKRIDLLNQLGFRIEIETKSDNYGTIIKLIFFR
jgi:ligand-binding sensor domain-containing protein